jgi:hypothetical protein
MAAETPTETAPNGPEGKLTEAGRPRARSRSGSSVWVRAIEMGVAKAARGRDGD